MWKIFEPTEKNNNSIIFHRKITEKDRKDSINFRERMGEIIHLCIYGVHIQRITYDLCNRLLLIQRYVYVVQCTFPKVIYFEVC